MRFSEIFTASLVAPLVAAHGGFPGAAKIIGLGQHDLASLRNRDIYGSHGSHAVKHQQGPQLAARQAGRCGKAYGCQSCAAGEGCSIEGYCGTTKEHTQSPDCQFVYGPGCDANKVPTGGSTRGTSRAKRGNQPYGGAGIYSCKVAGDIAITYDDGPYSYTGAVLDKFKAAGGVATFFVTGINLSKGSIDETAAWKNVIKRMEAEGHQIASHTWSHQDLSAITSAQRFDQMVRNEMAISNILGKFPTYMRPPYSSCNAGCQADLATLGYTISYFDLDTDDYNNLSPTLIQKSKDRVKAAVNGANPATKSFQAIAHDIHYDTAMNLTNYMLEIITKNKFKMVTLGQCLGEAKANWYRTPSARTASTSAFKAPTVCTTAASVTSKAPTATATGATTDGLCGTANRRTCLGYSAGQCCSQYGYCGLTTDHCGTGCQSGFGKCGAGAGAVASSSIKPSSSIKASTSTKASSAPASTATKKVSTDATCGGTNQYTCLNSGVGNCCSQYGWCGSTTDHCGTGCQRSFGTCT